MDAIDSSWIERLNHALQFTDFNKLYEFNGDYTLYVYFEKGNKSKIILHNIEDIPTQEKIETAEARKKLLIEDETRKQQLIEAERIREQKRKALAEEEVDTATINALENPLYTGTVLLLYAGKDQQGQFQIGYNDIANSCFLYTDYIVSAGTLDVNHKFYLTVDDIEILKKALKKYKEWVKIAKENQAIIGVPKDLGKEIPDLSIASNVVEDTHTKAPLVGDMHIRQPFSTNLSFRVMSYDAATHIFEIVSGDLSADMNALKAHIMMFAEPWADDLLAGLEKINADTIAKIKAEIERKKQKQEKDKNLFN